MVGAASGDPPTAERDRVVEFMTTTIATAAMRFL
jgi:hypothetical protein